MILIDALYINNSGGYRLLEYLVKRLIIKEISFFLLADKRCLGQLDYCTNVRYMKASLRDRASFYKERAGEFSSILCFGNIPAPIKLDLPVYTYFHNINLLTLNEAHSIKGKILMWLKREVFRHYKKNTDYWLVQTSNTADELVKHLHETTEKVKLMPFYELPTGIETQVGTTHGYDYVFVAIDTPGKGHRELFDAWRLLHQKGIDKTLHLTIQEESPLIPIIKELQTEGIKIVNHGLIPFKDVFELYRKSKAIIYPSHNESLGLGIVEALTVGCDVIGSDLPFLHAICEPSAVFNPYSSESIANAVISYENNSARKSELLIHDQVEELIKLLSH